jgi:succinate dehydrogenase assembly factor 2
MYTHQAVLCHSFRLLLSRILDSPPSQHTVSSTIDTIIKSQPSINTTMMRSSRSLIAATAKASRPHAAFQVCYYRGESGEMVQNLSEKEQKLVNMAIPRSEAIMERHVRFPKLDEIPTSSLGPSETVGDPTLELQVRRKRLIYRAKQRGWLEVDLLLGTWANQNVAALSPTELDDFEAFVNMDTIDIYNIVTLRMDVPLELQTEDKTGIVERIQEWARGHPLGKADPAMYEAVKKDNNLI